MWQKIKSFLFKNVTTRQTVAKNTLWLSVSNFGGRFIKAIVIIYAARVLGPSNWGVFSYAVTLSSFLILFTDLGINSILTKESAKAQTEEERTGLAATSFSMKAVLLAVGVLVVLFLGPFFTTLPGAKSLLPLTAFIMAFDTLRESGFSLIRSLEKMEWEAGIFLATNLAIVVFGLIFLSFSPTARSFTYGYVVGTGIGALVTVVALRNYFKKLITDISTKLIKPILKAAWPMAIAGSLALLLTSADILIISWLKTSSDVGSYSAATRIINLLYLLPAILSSSTLPLFSRLASKDSGKFRQTFEKALVLPYLISIPMALGGFILGKEITAFVFGTDYLSGASSLRVLMLTMIIDFPLSLIVSAIFAYNQQKKLIVSSAIGGISNVILDLLFIPKFGIVGSAYATFLAQFLTVAYLWSAMKKINYFKVLPHLKRIIGASIIMAGECLIISALGIHVLINVVISAATYFLLLKLLREPLFREIAAIWQPALLSANPDVAAENKVQI